jgi:phage head maturation protease
MESIQSNFSFAMQFSKATSGGKREIEGFASTTGVDRDGEYFPKELLTVAAEKYIKMGTLLFDHGNDSTYGRKPVGVLFEAKVDDAGRMYVRGRVSDDYIWKKIELDELKAFSIGGLASWEQDTNGLWYATALDIFEVSIVSVPANPEAIFSIAKSLKIGFDKAQKQDVDINQYNKSITTKEEEVMEDLLKSIQSKFDDFVSKDEEKKELKKSVETLTAEKTELEAKVEELNKSLEVEKENQAVLEESIKALDTKLEGLIATKKEAKTDEEVEETTPEKEEVTIEDAAEAVEKAYAKIFKR